MLENVRKFSYVRTFRLLGPSGEHVVQIDMATMSDEDRRHQELLFRAHLDGEPVNLTANGDDGPSIRNVYVVEVHSLAKEL